MFEVLREWWRGWEGEPKYGMVEFMIVIVILGFLSLLLHCLVSPESRYPVQQVSTIDRP